MVRVINWRKCIGLIVGWLICAPLVVASSALTPEEELARYRAAYPEESAVITDYWREVRMEIIGDSLQILVEQYEERLILDQVGGWGKDRVYSSSFRAVEDLKAYTLVPSKKKYKQVDVTDFKRSFDRNTYVFYDDTEIISYNFPEVNVGCKVVTRHTWKVTDPRLLGQFFFQSYVPVAKARFTVAVPEGVEIQEGLYGPSASDVIQFQKSRRDGQRVYEFTAESLPAIEYEEDNPSFNYLSPSAYVLVASYEGSGGESIPVLSSLDDLYAWYRSFLKNVDPDESLKELTREIVNEDDAEIEKIRKIFYWVQQNVKYIAFEQGMRGFIPNPPGEVLDKRYGDCKDMSCLLVGLLNTEGIPAKFTWIGSRDLPYRYTEMASPLVDNHMIATVEMGDSTLFLDATGSYSPLGFPTSMIQGKESLVGDGDQFVIREVPVLSKERSVISDTVFVRLANGTIEGRGSIHFSGFTRVDKAHQLIRRTENGEQKFMEQLLTKGNNKFFLKDYELSAVEDLDKPISIAYEFQVEDYYREIGDEIYLNLLLDKSLVNGTIEDRSTPMENDYKFIHRSVTVLDLPEDVKLSYQPDDQSWASDDFSFSVVYRLDGRRLFVTKTYDLDFLLLAPERFDRWNEGIKAYSKATRNSVVLKKTVE